jgi:hypothetical protein
MLERIEHARANTTIVRDETIARNLQQKKAIMNYVKGEDGRLTAPTNTAKTNLDLQTPVSAEFIHISWLSAEMTRFSSWTQKC